MPTFRDKCCRLFGCKPDDYEEHVLRHCLFPQAKALAWVTRIIDPGYFDEDRELIRCLGDTTSLEELRNEITDFRLDRPIKGYWRERWHVRVSGQRLTDLGSKLFKESGPG